VDIGESVDEIRAESWNAYWTELTGAESIEFLRDPRPSLVEEGIVGDDYRIETQLVNTEVASAAGGPHCKVLLVFPSEKLALLTVYRHPSG
jgi:hypothetical protein